jgi:hypothetical protein
MNLKTAHFKRVTGKDMESIQAWGAHPIHQEAKSLGMKRWYKSYTSMIAELERFHVKRS